MHIFERSTSHHNFLNIQDKAQKVAAPANDLPQLIIPYPPKLTKMHLVHDPVHTNANQTPE